MKPTTEVPDDPALPGLAAIRTVGLAHAIPALGLGADPVELRLCGYTPGERATLAVRVGDRQFAVKAYAEDPAPEAALYEVLAAAGLAPSGPGTGLANTSGVRVPPLVAWERELRVLVTGWLEGRPANRLIKEGQGERAGELCARWLQRAASLPVKIGPPLGSGRILYRAGEWVATLRAADPGLGRAASALARVLANTQPTSHTPRLVHGTFYARHVLDLGDGPGVIDWQRFGHGPLELDAGMFLATVWRSGRRNEAVAAQATRAERAFLAGTRGLLDERAVAWYRAAALLRLAGHVKVVSRRRPDWQARTLVALREAARLAEGAAQSDLVVRAGAPAFSRVSAALELVLQALSTRPATPQELEQIRRLLEEAKEHKPGRIDDVNDTDRA